MPRGGRSERPEAPLEDLIGGLDDAQLRGIVRGAVDRHPDVERAVRLAAARGDGDLSQLRIEVDRGLRTRRFLDYRQSIEWAQSARPILEELAAAAEHSPSAELVELLQRAVGHVIKVMQRYADDSSGALGALASELLDIHARVCDAGVADPVKLAAWMIRFRSKDQDFFEVDPVRYAAALGERGLSAYRRAVEGMPSADTFAADYARRRLAVLDRDVEAIVALHGGDLHSPHQFVDVAAAMAEIDRPDLVLYWSTRGIEETDGWQLAALYDLACATHEQLGQALEALRLRRAHHQRVPSTSTYAALKRAAEALDAWPVEREAARAVLHERDPRAEIAALLSDGDTELAWQAATAASADSLGPALWLALAEAREPTHPADALAVYLRLADDQLRDADRRAYTRAIRLLKQARRAAESANALDELAAHIAALRDTHRRRPTLIQMLDKAGFDDSTRTP